MFSGWTVEYIPQQGCGDEAAITAFKDAIPWNVGRDFVAGTAKHLSESLGLTKPGPPVKSSIIYDKQLQVLMPALGYGLTFPLTEMDVLRDCVTVYCEWLTSLLPKSKSYVPLPIIQDPNHYANIIINHFYYLFVPRGGQGADAINRQAVLCHRVLRTLQNISQSSNLMNEDTWQTLLLFLLHINNALLSPPTVKEDAGEQLCERVLSVLFEIWLLACSRCFPPPPLWAALRDSCQKWRHRAGLIQQWNRIDYCLTAKLVSFMYGPNFPTLYIAEDDLNVIPSTMSQDCITQVWYRILHIIGNPVDLCHPYIISKTPAFLKYAISSEKVIEPSHHACLQMLPEIFLSAMEGLSSLVDAFLGIPNTRSPLTKKFLFSSASASSISSEHSDDFDINALKSVVSGRPKCNSVLHLFGKWLFEAALINTNVKDSDWPPHLNAQQFESGKAEALGTLCRIFCSKKTGEEVLPVYLARFYIAVKEGLFLSDDFVSTPTIDSRKTSQYYAKKKECSETAISILINGVDMFRIDLKGVLTLIPRFMGVLQSILPEKDIVLSTNGPTVTILRRAATHVLLSLLPLPLHFQVVGIKEYGGGGSEKLKLSALRSQLIDLLFSALYVETDSTNIHMLLGGLLFCLQDLVHSEAVDSVSQCSYGTERDNSGHQSGAADSLGTQGSEFSSIGDDVLDPVESSQSTSTAPATSSDDFQLSEEDPDSTHSLFVKTIYLVCHRLISFWKADVKVSLAGLELLCGLAKLNIADQDLSECKRAVRWLCDYIVHQCSRPPQYHSKDLHSTIVAAFHCVGVWLVVHPYLLNDCECLATVIEVIELGISGSKSQVKLGEPPKFKHEKELKPASMRVRDAAEALLSCILSQVGSFPSVHGAECVSSLLDEATLLQHCSNWEDSDALLDESAVQHFRYFVSQNSIIFALLEQSLDPQPSVTAIIRGPFGRTTWTMQLRHLPRHRSSAKQYASNPGRPLPLTDISLKQNYIPKYFPDSIDRIPLCKADKSIPPLENIVHISEKSSIEHDKMLQILDHQISFEENIKQQMDGQGKDYPDLDIECSPPSLCQEFQTARLVLSHLGLLSFDSLQASSSSSVPSLVSLDINHHGFLKDLETLDKTNNRTIDTIHIFYVKAGQVNPEDILNNVISASYVHPHFLELLSGLGWAVNVYKHPGWTGHTSTAFCDINSPLADANVSSGHGGGLYSGHSHVLYWADAFSEIAYIVPTSHPCTHHLSVHSASNLLQSDTKHEVRESSVAGSEHSDSFNTCELSEDLGTSSLSSHASQVSGAQSSEHKRKYGRQVSSVQCCDQKILLVWLESYDDYATFPKEELLCHTNTGLESTHWLEKVPNVFIIFIHALTNGLFRIKLQGQNSKLGFAGPLVDGQVVSRRVLASLIRQIVLNVGQRRTLESDSYQPPHVRRKLRIQDMVNKYKRDLSEPEFYANLFTGFI